MYTAVRTTYLNSFLPAIHLLRRMLPVPREARALLVLRNQRQVALNLNRLGAAEAARVARRLRVRRFLRVPQNGFGVVGDVRVLLVVVVALEDGVVVHAAVPVRVLAG
jgi:hypothetical protein